MEPQTVEAETTDELWWSAVDQSEEFQSLPHTDKVQAQQSYFNEVVAPNLSDAEVDAARDDFLSQYTYSPKAFQQASESMAIAESLGIPPEEIDTKTGAEFWDRVDYSASDTDEEVVGKFASNYPDGVMFRVEIPRKTVFGKLVQPSSRLLFKYDGNDADEKYKTIKDVGVSYKDMSDLAAPVTKAAVSIGIGVATAGTSIWSQLLAYGGGAALAHLGKEGIEEARGTQLQSFEEVMAQAAIEGAVGAGSVVASAVVTKAANILTGRGALNQQTDLSALVREINKAKAEGMKLEDLAIHQKVPENKIISRLGAQAESTSKSLGNKITAQKVSAFDALIAQENRTALQSQKKIMTHAGRFYKQEINSLKNKLGRVTRRQGDKALLEGVREFVDNSRKYVNLKYSLADEAAALELPLFDLSPAIAKGKSIRELVLGYRDEIERKVVIPGRHLKGKRITQDRTTTVTEQPAPINVANTPEMQLIGVIDDLSKLSADVIDYEVIKQLRTRTGNVIETWPWEASVNKGQAKALYRTLTDVLNNPVTKAPKFVKAHGEAAASARARSDFLDAPSIQKMVKSEASGKLIKQLSAQDALTPAHISMFSSKSYPGDKLKLIKQGIKTQILLDEGGSRKALQAFMDNDSVAWRFLVQKGDERALFSIANDIDKLNNSNIGQLVQKGVKATEVLEDLILKKGTSRGDINEIAVALGESGRDDLRSAIFNDIISKTVTTMKGIRTLDKKSLINVLDEYKSLGVWDSNILTKTDKIKLTGLKAYMELVFYRGADAGVSLEAAQAISNLKHPATFFAGVHQLTANKLVGMFMTSKAANKLVLGSGKKGFDSEPLTHLQLFVRGILEGTEPGDQSMMPIPAAAK